MLEILSLRTVRLRWTPEDILLISSKTLWPFVSKQKNVQILSTGTMHAETTHIYVCMCVYGLSCGSVVKNLPANAGDTGSIPGWGRSPGEENGNPLQFSCLRNAMDRGA